MSKADWERIVKEATLEARATGNPMMGAEINWRIKAKVNQFFGMGNGSMVEDAE